MADETEEQRELREDREAFVALADLFEDAVYKTVMAVSRGSTSRDASKAAWATFAGALVDYAQDDRR